MTVNEETAIRGMIDCCIYYSSGGILWRRRPRTRTDDAIGKPSMWCGFITISLSSTNRYNRWDPHLYYPSPWSVVRTHKIRSIYKSINWKSKIADDWAVLRRTTITVRERGESIGRELNHMKSGSNNISDDAGLKQLNRMEKSQSVYD